MMLYWLDVSTGFRHLLGHATGTNSARRGGCACGLESSSTYRDSQKRPEREGWSWSRLVFFRLWANLWYIICTPAAMLKTFARKEKLQTVEYQLHRGAWWQCRTCTGHSSTFELSRCLETEALTAGRVVMWCNVPPWTVIQCIFIY